MKSATALLGAFLLNPTSLVEPLHVLTHADGAPFASWYQSLEVPKSPEFPNGGRCCGDEDCKPVRAEIRRDEAGSARWWIPNEDWNTAPDRPKMIPVPEDRIIHATSNPIGEAVVCWYAGQLRCFVPLSGV